jgi:hypothetical protein
MAIPSVGSTRVSEIAQSEIETLQQHVAGPVFARGDEGRAQEVAGFNAIVSHAPDVVIGATSAEDVAAAVRFASKHRLPVSVQATGHGATTALANGLLLTTSRMNAVSIDRGTKIATMGAGVRWRAVIDAAAEFGLTPIIGSSPNVGAIGYTLGGGVGPLVRTYGFSADYVRGFEVVTADGEIRRANRVEHPDLFWALCGGKGGLGVVTSMQFELVPLTRLYAGALFFDTEHIETALRAWTDWVTTTPETATSSIALMRLPNIDLVPPPLRGRNVLNVRYAFVGDSAEGERILAPMRGAAPVYIDMVSEIPATAIGSVHNDPAGPLPTWSRGMMLKAIDQDFITKLLAVVGPGIEVPLVVVEIRHVDGATTRMPEGGNAVGGRRSPFTFAIIAAPVPALFESVAPRVADVVSTAIAEWVSPESNINFAMPIRSAEHYASCWPPAVLERLESVKAKYDPTGLFAFARA